MRRFPLFLALAASLAACGGSQTEPTLPDESDDLDVGGPRISPHLEGTTPADASLYGTRWAFVEAECTEGPLELVNFTRAAEVNPATGPGGRTEAGFVIVYDHAFEPGEDDEGPGCRETVVQRATPGAETDQEWAMHEEARVTVGECTTRTESDRPGDVRLRGQFLEVYVQRSNWCNGLEVKMVYAPAPPGAGERDGEQVIRHYVAHWNRRDAQSLTLLFSQNGSLVEPFNRTVTDQPTRHDGRAQIFEWFSGAFSQTPWLALRLIGVEPGAVPGAFTMRWHYMDPRLDAPFGGRNLFTVAGGEIFETEIAITESQVELEDPTQEASEAAPDVTSEQDLEAEHELGREAASEGEAEAEAERDEQVGGAE
ncbi:MAG: hypothetical protein AAGH15_24865 [Myxococcota bacterium]